LLLVLVAAKTQETTLILYLLAWSKAAAVALNNVVWVLGRLLGAPIQAPAVVMAGLRHQLFMPVLQTPVWVAAVLAGILPLLAMVV
jgi:hypothetical protein